MEWHEQRDREDRDRGQAGLSRGTNQTSLRLYNERLVLSLIRRNGALPKAEIARLTGLSAQTISVIMRQLEADRLVRREAPLRGRIGQPSVPYSLNRHGAFAVGMKIGRRSADFVLMNFVGEVIGSQHDTYPFPTPEIIVEFLRHGHESLVETLGETKAARVCGLGVAMPSELWSWADEAGAPAGDMDEWKDFDINEAFSGICRLPVYVCNDATAACGAELTFGIGSNLPDYLYFFVGTFVGGGLVLGGSLYPGKRGNAAAVGSILLPDGGGPGPSYRQLIQSASIYMLEKRMQEHGMDPARLWDAGNDWSGLGEVLNDWIDDVANGLAFAIVSSVSVIDLENVVIDGAFPAPVRSRLVERTRTAFQKLDRQGLLPVTLLEGTIGDRARVLGAASLPLLAQFTRDSELLFKDDLDANPTVSRRRRGA